MGVQQEKCRRTRVCVFCCLVVFSSASRVKPIEENQATHKDVQKERSKTLKKLSGSL